jgi:Lipid A 3-O-deacylase (PagL)
MEARAQLSSGAGSGASSGSAPASAPRDSTIGVTPRTTPAPLAPPFRGGPLVTGVNVWVGTALSVRTASNNERFDGSAFRMMGVQFSRSLFVRGGVQFSWLVEVLPAIVATVGAPENRLPTPNRAPEIYRDPARLARYTLHDVYGVGLAPLGAEATKPLSRNLSAMFNVTAGGAFFNAVIPYGKATQANFTVAPAIGLEWQVARGYALSSGYTLHHLSNASFGDSNPGLNSHLVFVRLARARYR